jgi:hypothetical protein
MSGNNSRLGQGDDQGPPHPSARGLPMHYPIIHPFGMEGFHMSYMHQYVQVLVHLDPTDTGLTRHRQWLPP